MSIPSYKSFCLTIRPLNGITDETVLAVKSWLKKQPFAFGILEKENEARHLHAQIWNSTPRARGDICKSLVSICERTIPDWSVSQKKVLRNGVRIGYSDWYLDYLADNFSKMEIEEIQEVIINNPPDLTEGFYPSESETEKVKLRANLKRMSLFELEEQLPSYLETHDLKLTLFNIGKFLSYLVYVKRTLMPLANLRDRLALRDNLFYFVTKDESGSAFATKEELDKERALNENVKVLIEKYT